MINFNDSLFRYPVAMLNLWMDVADVKLPSENICTYIKKKIKTGKSPGGN